MELGQFARTPNDGARVIPQANSARGPGREIPV
jgi:hypothetical protein